MTATVSKIADAKQAFAYYSERDDYYLSDKSAAEWYGSGAEQLGLSGDLRPQEFHDVLTGRVRDVQVGTSERHTPGWDLTFSAPKSVSIASLVNKDERITQAHDRAVRAALDHLEQHSIVTRQRGETEGYDWRETGSLVAGVVRHSTSRNLDPQLHSHCVVANMTFDATSGKWVSIDSRAGLYRDQREVGNIYMNELARGVREAGYDVEWRVDERGNAAFEITDVPEAERAAFSTRRAEIEAALLDRGIEIDKASGAAREAATLDTRSAKEHVPGKELHARWEQQARALGFDTTGRPKGKEAATPEARAKLAAEAVARATGSITERQTRFTRRALLQEATTYAQGKVSQADLQAAVIEAREAGSLIDKSVQIRGYDKSLTATNGFTTQSGIETEADMLRRAQSIAERAPSLSLSGNQIENLVVQREQRTGFEFTQEQRHATTAILSGKGGLSVLQGYAGSAKTTSVLAAVSDAAREQKVRVRAIAPTHSAADSLGKAIDGESGTVAALINRPLERDGRRECWIVDEAGMVSAKDMQRLLTRADQSGAQVVLTGDTRQIGSVGAGSAFQQIQDSHQSETYQLTEIKRQSNAELRAAVYDALHGDFASALGKVEVVEQERSLAVESIAERYMRETSSGKSTLVVTLSRQDRTDVNEAIQSQRVEVGEVRNVQEVATLTSKQSTETEQRDAARYQPGDVIESHRNFKRGPQRGELATVESVSAGKVTARLQSGETWTFDPRRLTKYSVLERSETSIGTGDRITAKGAIKAADASEPDKSIHIKNGTSLTVEKIEGGKVTARLDDNRSVIIDTQAGAKIDLNYAETANQAQGRTVDSVIAYMRSSQTNLADRQHSYVAMSRARESALIVTDDKDQLAETLSKSAHGKEAAHDPGERQQQAAQVEQRPLSSRAKEWAADTLAKIQNGREDRRARERMRRAERFAKQDRKWLKKGVKIRGKVEKQSKKIEREITKRYGTNMRAGTLGKLFEGKSKRKGREIIERVQANREAALQRIDKSLVRARERSVDREARQHRISSADARTRVDERTLIDRHFRAEKYAAQFVKWMSEAVNGNGTSTQQPQQAPANRDGGNTGWTLQQQLDARLEKQRAERAERERSTAKTPTRDNTIGLLPDAQTTPAAEPSRAPDHTPNRGRDDSHEIDL